jgi:phosphatidylglycerol---prolipoprotein diacylglyceryl transferase
MSIYGLLIGIAIVVFINYFQKNNKFIPKSKENIFLFLLIIFTFLGARLYFVLTQLSFFVENPNQIFNTRGGGLGFLGGLIGATLFLIIYSKIHKINLIKLTDSFITIVPLGQALGRIGNWINKEIYPVCIYEFFLNLTLFLILLKTKKNKTAIYLISYSFFRFILEFFRPDALVYHLGHIISLIGILLGIIIISNDKYISRRQSS